MTTGPVPTTPPGVVTPHARFQVYVSTSRCFWRLLGRNNRAYGRSAQVSVSLEETRDSALLVGRAVVDGSFELSSTSGREWGWLLVLDGVAVARSDGTYGRRVECLAGIERFKLAAPGAPLAYVRLIPRDLGRNTPVVGR